MQRSSVDVIALDFRTNILRRRKECISFGRKSLSCMERVMVLRLLMHTTSVRVTHATTTETETMNLSFGSYVFAVFQLIFFSFIGNISIHINHTVACIFDISIF